MDQSKKPNDYGSSQSFKTLHFPQHKSNSKINDHIRSCSCKKVKCQKMYCECYNYGIRCSEACRCIDCHNTQNPEFQKKWDSIQGEEMRRIRRGCNCKKTGCLKKYCECYNAGLSCSQICGCQDCRNGLNEQESPINGQTSMIEYLQVNSTVQVKQINNGSLKKKEILQTKIKEIKQLFPQTSSQSILTYLAYVLNY